MLRWVRHLHDLHLVLLNQIEKIFDVCPVKCATLRWKRNRVDVLQWARSFSDCCTYLSLDCPWARLGCRCVALALSSCHCRPQTCHQLCLVALDAGLEWGMMVIVQKTVIFNALLDQGWLFDIFLGLKLTVASLSLTVLVGCSLIVGMMLLLPVRSVTLAVVIACMTVSAGMTELALVTSRHRKLCSPTHEVGRLCIYYCSIRWSSVAAAFIYSAVAELNVGHHEGHLILDWVVIFKSTALRKHFSCRRFALLDNTVQHFALQILVHVVRVWRWWHSVLW